MKAFEEWRDEAIREGKIWGSDSWAVEQAWQSALEWFYDKLGYSEEHEELKDLIEKELEDK